MHPNALDFIAVKETHLKATSKESYIWERYNKSVACF
jgi:hypothetical protein